MGALGGLLGLNGGTGGTGFNPASLIQAVNPEMGTYTYDRSVSSLDQQQRMLQALQGVNGIGNQQNALQSQLSLAQQQQGTAGQYQNLANGIGPNPAQAQLAQNTAANVAQTGALMAGQRGASQNVGLIARQAGQQGMQAQQQAAGQAATLQAQQQIAGLQGLAGQQAQIGQTNQNAAQIAGSQVSNQVGQTNAVTGANQSQYSNILNAIGGYNNAQVGINNANAQLANSQVQGGQGLIGGLLGGSGLIGGLFKAEGGEIGMAEGGAFPGQSEFGSFLSQIQSGATPGMPSFGENKGAGELQKGLASAVGNAGSLFKSSAPAGEWAGADSPGGFSNLAAKGGDMKKDFRVGGKVNASAGQKAVKGGDDYANDKIPAVLSEHEIVLPRSVTLSQDPVGNAARFVQQVIAKRGRK